ncbi:AI-2E family transporter [Haloferula sargassicola]|uniref:AI-2E family transporter n=1 Tax=Haloferula sargassicola TaxID=490096 RepID=A0ABP9ULD6_9BACT
MISEQATAEEAPEDDSFSDRRSRFCSLRDSVNVISVSQVGLFVLVGAWVLHETKSVLLPVVLAALVSLVLYPVYRLFRQVRIPRMLASLLTVAGLMGLLGFGAYQLSEPGEQWMDSINRDVVARRLQEVFRPVKQVQSEIKRMASKMEAVTQAADQKVPEDGQEDAESNDASGDDMQVAIEVTGSTAPAADPEDDTGPVRVQIQEDPLDTVLAGTQDFGVAAVAFLFIVLFGLAYGNRIVRRLSEEEHTAAILERMGEDVARYLFTITAINFCLGLAIGLAMWALGMPNPALWGVLGMVLNFIPYLGALIGTGIVFLAAAATFETPGHVLIVPVAYFALTAIEGNLITPMVLGERFRLNPLIVFLWIFAWAGFWGVAGMLIAMPALVTFKIVCENTATMERFRRVLTA